MAFLRLKKSSLSLTAMTNPIVLTRQTNSVFVGIINNQKTPANRLIAEAFDFIQEIFLGLHLAIVKAQSLI